MTDVLKPLSPAEVAAFYKRLADFTEKRKGTVSRSLAAELLRLWLANRDRKWTYPILPPEHLKNHSVILAGAAEHRRVYLTEQEKNTGGWGGILARWNNNVWKGVGPLDMFYESLIGFSVLYQYTGSDADKDLLYSLHDCQLRSDVTVNLVASDAKHLYVKFTRFELSVKDIYNWDYKKHIEVPNPDYGSKMPNAVAPSSESVTVYHSNAKRVEDANLAAPYALTIGTWSAPDDLKTQGIVRIRKI